MKKNRLKINENNLTITIIIFKKMSNHAQPPPSEQLDSSEAPPQNESSLNASAVTDNVSESR